MENDEREKQDGGGAAAFSVIGVLLVVLFLYVLSAGPAVVVLPRGTWTVAYMPLMIVAYFVPPVGNVLMWYVNLWI